MSDPRLPRVPRIEAPGGTYAKMIGRVRRRQRQRIGLVVLGALGLGVFAAMLAATDHRAARTAAQPATSVVTSSAVGPSELPAVTIATSSPCLRSGSVLDSHGAPVPGVLVTPIGGDGRAVTRTAAGGTWSWTGPADVALLLSPAGSSSLAPATVVAGCHQGVTTVLQPGAAR